MLTFNQISLRVSNYVKFKENGSVFHNLNSMFEYNVQVFSG